MNDLLSKYSAIRLHTVTLCDPLQIEDYIPQAVDFTSPPKWHLAHTTWFFEQMILKENLKDYSEFDSNYNFLFNSYYNTLGDRIFRGNRGDITRPGVEEVYAYRKYVDQGMIELLKDNVSPELEDLIVLGLNHEQQHQELLITDLKFTFGLNPTFPVYHKEASFTASCAANDEWVTIEEGVYPIGHDDSTFCFDNELGAHKVYIHKCQIAKSLVTNAEYIEFIKDGGYEKFQYWLDEGWSWVNENNVQSPLYWIEKGGEWYQYTLSGLQKINLAEAVCHVSFFEASAFAFWKGMRLATEFEWEVASEKINWGDRWEWTNSAYLPYPNFKIKKGAVGEYNGKFMVNQMVLRGASNATSPGHSRKTYRNFFQTNHQWQFTGIRLVK